MSSLQAKLLLTAVAVPAAMVFHASAGETCCGPSATHQINADAASADETFAAVQDAQDVTAALAAAKVFVEKHPTDERSQQLFYVLAQYSEDDIERKAYYEKLVEHHPDSNFAEMAAGSIKQLDKLGHPFELTFTPVGSDQELNLQEDLRGKVVVIDFWATWCGPCVADMPKLKTLYEQFKDKGVEFIGVSLDSPEAEGGKTALEDFVASNDIPWPQYYQGNGWQSEFSMSWGVNAIPQLFVIDADGKLYSTQARGNLEEILTQLTNDVADGEAVSSAN